MYILDLIPRKLQLVKYLEGQQILIREDDTQTEVLSV